MHPSEFSDGGGVRLVAHVLSHIKYVPGADSGQVWGLLESLACSHCRS